MFTSMPGIITQRTRHTGGADLASRSAMARPFAVLVLAALLVAAKEPPKVIRARVEVLRRNASKLILGGQFEEGIAMLQEASDLARDPQALLEMANAFDEWGGHCAQAIDTFHRFFAECATCG